MIRFVINEKLPSLNDYINKLKSPHGKHIGAKFKEDTDNICISYMLPYRQQLKRVCQQPVIILFDWHEKTKRRDLDNVYSAKKYILDAMQKAGVIQNDNYTYIKGLYDSITYDGQDKVVITVTPIDNYRQLHEFYYTKEKTRLQQEQRKG